MPKLHTTKAGHTYLYKKGDTIPWNFNTEYHYRNNDTGEYAEQRAGVLGSRIKDYESRGYRLVVSERYAGQYTIGMYDEYETLRGHMWNKRAFLFHPVTPDSIFWKEVNTWIQQA